MGVCLLVMMGMMGWTEFSIGLIKNQELVRRCLDIATEFYITLAKALIDEASPDGMYM